MKSLLKILLPLAMAFIATSGFAQQKVGHINADAVIAAMPEREEAMKQLDAYQKEHEETYQAIQKEFQDKNAVYEERRDTYTPAIREQRENELTSLYQKLEEYPSVVQRGGQELWQKLMTPIQEKVMGAIEKVAKANSFAYVVNSMALMYSDDVQMVDLVPLVKKELGLQ